ncbi:TPA: hypothetical protein DHT42_01965 [Candidatus Nomurabacteria bacterium]|nr:MAG: hypothetical protein UT80_C0029G0006 [Parcubacteria group bacterium GW2011_GWC1_40_13]HCY17943.1 hypothetical protein [Candidatus Nomurabacteria bacterium]
MKTFSLKSKFYIIFSLLLSVPASFLAMVITAFINSLPPTNFFYNLSSLGIIEAPTTVIILLFFFWLFNEYVWKVYLIRKMIGIPNINGRYEGSLVSTYTESKEQNGTYPIAIEINQTLTSINVFLYTERSCSYSLIANLCTNNNNNHELVYVYQNKTSALNTDTDMRDHNGTAYLEIFDDGKILKGNYFNNPRERGRFGKMEVTKVTSKVKGKF